MEIAILSSAYFGPVQWYQKLNRYDKCLIERYDHFVKQTYRNRCIIMTTQGPQSLTVPIEKFEALKCPMKDVRISDHGNWKHLHWNALMSAYGESPFFEFYTDDIRPFFEKQWKYLYDFNWEITEKVCELLDLRPHIEPTDEYLAPCRHDFRDVIRPKHPLPDEGFLPRKYYQVYGQKYGFVANLSILDLLFNEGNEAIFYL
ncbi:MAG: WbqC family protein [Prevotella sp.]|jgi:hypothetical protein|nr:WbqC family protein [Prevotella sp.]MCI2080802.1 WbqC family protein [Prevotella sp.]MCI2102721.1 WbqC family protein [Prevotella sp.]HCN52820.1 hypothetical protein [Prevotella sp.]